jgi:hypothetical protein
MRLLIVLMMVCFNKICVAQTPTFSAPKVNKTLKQDVFSANVFIENIGQYASTVDGYENMGVIKYGYEGLGMPVLFTTKGLIHLQRKVEKISDTEEKQFEKKGIPEEEIERKRNITDRVITMEWLNANADVKIIAEARESAYHTYGMLSEKAYGYKKITYKNLYPNIDVIYTFTNNTKAGFEYSLLLQPGADISLVKLKYGGDVKKITTDNKGNLIIRSDIEGISATVPVSYYGEKLINKSFSDVATAYKIADNEISFSFPKGYDSTKAFIIDPFVSSTNNLTGENSGKAYDVDFDYEGNVYVSGGGFNTNSAPSSVNYKAKYNSAGILQWTFSGVIAIPSWTAGYGIGGWVVDKVTGAIYIGQGFDPNGYRVVRINTNGLYDNYVSTPNPNFQEAWKLYYSCNNGSPQIICAGGGTNANNNIAICSPPSTTLTNGVNLTGSLFPYQDICDLVVDPVTNSMYSIFASGLDKSIENKIFKHNQPYTLANTAWSSPSGFTVLGEIRNRPYISFPFSDNSTNMLALNANYLFYWDGFNLRAYNKTTGVAVGTALTVAGNVSLMQGGIVADACNNVFIGSVGGLIRVYNFNGTTFDDAAAVDINIAGYNTSVYDLALDESKKILYASGNGFVASYDVAAYCTSNIYTVSVATNCATSTATVTLSPIPPLGASISYTLYIGNTIIATNTTGIFIGLLSNTTYTVTTTINYACNILKINTNFILTAPTISTTATPTTCGNSIGEINITASGTLAPYTYSLDGITYVATNLFTALAEGLYTVYVKDANGCINKTNVIIQNSNGPTFTAAIINSTCGFNNGTITLTAAAGTSPYFFSNNNGVTYQASNIFIGLAVGNYIVKIKDAVGCTNTANITVVGGLVPILSATGSTATCGQNNGSITAFGSSGTPPYLYSLDGSSFQTSNLFLNLTPGTYTVFVKDAIGCINTVTTVVANNAAPTFTIISTNSNCGNLNGSITVNAINGVAPLSYSINGTTFQPSSTFLGLGADTYNITVRDATGCIVNGTVTILTTLAPGITATSTPANCGSNNGSITITGIGAGIVSYSIDGINYNTSSNIFTNLAAGNYTVFVKNVNSCVAFTTIQINSITNLAVSASATSASCNVNDGSITINATGGNAPFQYSINGSTYVSNNIFTNLAPNTYTVYVKDASGCIRTTTILVTGVSGLTLSAGTVAGSCGNNGSITAIATGGIAPLQCNINGNVFQAATVFNNLAAGTYIIGVKDANNCAISITVIVSILPSPTITATTTIASCSTNNGTITAIAAGGTPPLQYSINGINYFTTNIFTNLAANSYTVYVKDALNCIKNINVEVANTSGLKLVLNTLSSSCGNNSIITATATGGVAPLSYNINGGVYQASNIFNNLATGFYTVNVKDANGCIATKQVNIIASAPLTLSASVVLQATCASANAVIVAVAAAGAPPYSYSIDGTNYQSAATFPNLATGTYTVYLRDAVGCTATQTGLVVTTGTAGTPVTTFTVSVRYNPCIGDINGTITFPKVNGIFDANCTFMLDFSGTFIPFAFNLFSNVTPGIHYVTAKNIDGCTKTILVNLVAPPAPTATAVVVPTACQSASGSITLTGVGPGSTFLVSTNLGVTWIPFFPSITFNNLLAGSYSYIISDNINLYTQPYTANGCTSIISVVVPSTNGNVNIAITKVNTSCNLNNGSITAVGSAGIPPYTYNINGGVYQTNNIFNGLAAGTYIVGTKDNAGCIKTESITITNSGIPAVTFSVINTSCGLSNGSITVNTGNTGVAPFEYSINGITFQASNIFNNLSAMAYTIFVKDAANCFASNSVLVGSSNASKLNAFTTAASCNNNDGKIFCVGLFGLTPYSFSLDGIVYQSSSLFTGLAAGAYTAYMKDASGCVATIGVVIGNTNGVAFTTTIVASKCGSANGSITINATGGTAPYQYSSDGGLTFQTGNNIFSSLLAGTYTVVVKDANGCITTNIVIVNNNSGPQTLTAAIINASCGLANGTATLSQTGGILPYGYSKDGITYQPSNVLTGFAAGTYTLYVRDGNLCIKTVQITITNLPPALLSTIITAASCGLNDGTITANASGGSQSLSYSKDGTTFQASNIFTGLAAGAYTITVKDARGCITSSNNDVAVIGVAPPPIITCNSISGTAINFSWATVAAATGYSISYKINAGAVINIGAIGNVLNYTVNGLVGGDNVTFTLTPTGIGCLSSATKVCSIAACASTTASISYAGPFCTNITIAQPVSLTGTGLFTGGTYSSTVGLSINTTTGAIVASASTAATYLVTYTKLGVAGCPNTIATTSVTINPKPTPILISHN